jgi:hypothetical protein
MTWNFPHFFVKHFRRGSFLKALQKAVSEEKKKRRWVGAFRMGSADLQMYVGVRFCF